MCLYSNRDSVSLYKKIIIIIILITFSFTSVISPSYAQSITAPFMPQPGTMVMQSAAYVPMLLKGMTIYPDAPLKFDFIIDSGNSELSGEEIATESKKLVNYFLASMTVPKDELWVNLSPVEQDRIVPDALGKTELGRDLLAQDYLLKQLTASLMYPEKELGQKFWDRVYEKAQKKFGTTDIPQDAFSKVWILPESATVYEHGNTVYIVESKLKVMTDIDYSAMQNNRRGKELRGREVEQSLPLTSAQSAGPEAIPQPQADTSQIIKEIIIPEIEKEVNTGKNFAPLRQIYHSLILAKWYKETIKNSILNQVYVDKNKVTGLEIYNPVIPVLSEAKIPGSHMGDSGIAMQTGMTDEKTNVIEEIYAQYMEAYKKGVYNYIKEDYDAKTQQIIPKKYFSGGFHDADIDMQRIADQRAIQASVVGQNSKLSVKLDPQSGQSKDVIPAKTGISEYDAITENDSDEAMIGSPWTLNGARKMLDSVYKYSYPQSIKAIRKIADSDKAGIPDVSRIVNLLSYDNVSEEAFAALGKMQNAYARRVFRSASKLEERIPQGKHYSLLSEVKRLLPEAMKMEVEGYDFEIIYQEEVLGRGIIKDGYYTIPAPPDYMSGSGGDWGIAYQYEADMQAHLESWVQPEYGDVVDSPDAVKIIRGIINETGARKLIEAKLESDQRSAISDENIAQVIKIAKKVGYKKEPPFSIKPIFEQGDIVVVPEEGHWEPGLTRDEKLEMYPTDAAYAVSSDPDTWVVDKPAVTEKGDIFIGIEIIPTEADEAMLGSLQKGDMSFILINYFHNNISYFTLVGKPGSGKGTVSEVMLAQLNKDLPEKEQYQTLVMGDIIRAIMKLKAAKGTDKENEVFAQFAEYVPFINLISDDEVAAMKRGELISDQTAVNIVNTMLAENPRLKDAKRIFFDGFPRTQYQLDAMQNGNILHQGKSVKMDFYAEIDVPSKELIARVKRRAAEKVAKGEEIRPDDTPEKMKVRLKEYDTLTAPMVETLKTLPKNDVFFLSINGVTELPENPKPEDIEESKAEVRTRLFKSIRNSLTDEDRRNAIVAALNKKGFSFDYLTAILRDERILDQGYFYSGGHLSVETILLDGKIDDNRPIDYVILRDGTKVDPKDALSMIKGPARLYKVKDANWALLVWGDINNGFELPGKGKAVASAEGNAFEYIKKSRIVAGLHTVTGGKGYLNLLKEKGPENIAGLALELVHKGIVPFVDNVDVLKAIKNRNPKAIAGFFYIDGITFEEVSEALRAGADIIVGDNLAESTIANIRDIKNNTVVFTSVNKGSSTFEDDLKYAMESGADGIQLKPFGQFTDEDFNDLPEAVRMINEYDPDILVIGAGGIFQSRINGVLSMNNSIIAAVGFNAQNVSALDEQIAEYRANMPEDNDEAMTVSNLTKISLLGLKKQDFDPSRRKFLRNVTIGAAAFSILGFCAGCGITDPESPNYLSPQEIRNHLDKLDLPEPYQVLGHPSYLAIANSGESSIPTLIEYVQDTSNPYDSRKWAFRLIGEVGNLKNGFDFLVSALKSDSPLYSGWHEIEIENGIGIIFSKESLSTCIDYLRNYDYTEVRLIVLSIIVRRGDPAAVNSMIDLMSDPDIGVEVIFAVAFFGDQRAVEPLLGLISQERLQARVIHALVDLDDERAIDPIINVLQTSEKSSGRAAAAYAIGHFRVASAYDLLISALVNDTYEHVRAGAVYSLGEINNVGAIPYIINALQDESEYVRNNAVIALGKFNDSVAIEPIINALLVEVEASVQINMVEVLADFGDVRAVDAIIGILQNGASYEAKEAAAIALGVLGDPAASEALFNAFASHYDPANLQYDSLLKALIEAMGSIGGEQIITDLCKWLERNITYTNIESDIYAAINSMDGAIDILLNVFSDTDPNGGSVGALEVLAVIGDERIIEPLSDILFAGSRSNMVREYAAYALGELGDEAALPALRYAAENDYHANVRRAANAAIDKILNGRSKSKRLIGKIDTRDRMQVIRRLVLIVSIRALKQKLEVRGGPILDNRIDWENDYERLRLTQELSEMEKELAEIEVRNVDEAMTGKTDQRPETRDHRLNEKDVGGIDNAQTSDSATRGIDSSLQKEVGGIDLNNIDINRKGEANAIKFDNDALEPLLGQNITGFAPIIIDIVPLNSILPVLGLKDMDGKEQRAKGKEKQEVMELSSAVKD